MKKEFFCDQILLKSDGFPTYHLANVVDDHLMGVTQVIRAEEWIPSTPKHLALYRAFGWEPPEFVHMPLLRNKNRSKISKRKNPVSLDYYRRAGFLPEAMVNFLANMGYSFGDDQEKFTLDEMLANFDLARVSLGEPVFDLEKLAWLNGLYIRDLKPEDLTDRIMDQVFNREMVSKIVPLIQERMEHLDQFVTKTAYFFSGSELAYAPELLVAKKTTPQESRKTLSAATEVLGRLKDWTSDSIEGALRGIVEELGLKVGQVFMPIRVAVTGGKASPGLFETMEAIGKPMCQARLRVAVKRVGSVKKV